MNAPSKDALNNNTYVTLGSALAIVLTLFTLAAKVEARFDRQEERLARLEWHMDALEHSFDDAAGDRWRGDQMRSWVRELAAANPDLNVPLIE